MDREILFRIKDKWCKAWYYGMPIRPVDADDKTCAFQGEDKNGSSYYNILAETETLGQYTGLTDKNGTKIFEGDIVLTQEYSTRPFAKNAKRKRLIGVVEYYEQKHYGKNVIYNNGYRVKIKNQGKYICGAWSDFYDCEVIGNIHDNPELLEEL